MTCPSGRLEESGVDRADSVYAVEPLAPGSHDQTPTVLVPDQGSLPVSPPTGETVDECPERPTSSGVGHDHSVGDAGQCPPPSRPTRTKKTAPAL